MVTFLVSSNAMTQRKEGETIEDHILRHKTDTQRSQFIQKANYEAQQEAIKGAQID